jgi:hypothetical protein
VTDSDHGGRGERRRTPERSTETVPPLDEPVAGRATLARRLRAVERALAGADGVEFRTGAAPDDPEALADRLDAVEARIDALCEAVRAVGECLVARDRARRIDDGTESVRRAVEALPDTPSGAGRIETSAAEPDDGAGEEDAAAGTVPGTTVGGDAVSDGGESPVEWLDRVAAGGVAPPPVE